MDLNVDIFKFWRLAVLPLLVGCACNQDRVGKGIQAAEPVRDCAACIVATVNPIAADTLRGLGCWEAESVIAATDAWERSDTSIFVMRILASPASVANRSELEGPELRDAVLKGRFDYLVLGAGRTRGVVAGTLGVVGPYDDLVGKEPFHVRVDERSLEFREAVERIERSIARFPEEVHFSRDRLDSVDLFVIVRKSGDEVSCTSLVNPTEPGLAHEDWEKRWGEVVLTIRDVLELDTRH